MVGSSLPWLLPPAIHHLRGLERARGRLGRPRRAAAPRRRLRRAFDLEHWAAFQRSFDALADAASRERRRDGDGVPAPASISVLSGDVHHSYVARADLGRPCTPVHQLTCSPMHNQVPAVMRPVMRFGWSRAGRPGALRAAGRARPACRAAFRWRRLAGPYFGNAVSTLRHRGGTAEVTIEGTTSDGELFEVASVELTR